MEIFNCLVHVVIRNGEDAQIDFYSDLKRCEDAAEAEQLITQEAVAKHGPKASVTVKINPLNIELLQAFLREELAASDEWDESFE